jgi:hypothetical protein
VLVLETDTVTTIRAHAGLNEPTAGGAAISEALVHGEGVDAALASFVEALQRLNIEVNGSVPSDSIGGEDVALPSGLVYAVAEVSRMLRAARRDDDAWAVDTAWLAVLAGDIDDIGEHVAQERTARS